MIEILVVVGIIFVLVALGVTAMQGLTDQGNRNRTRTALSNAASMLAEYETRAGLTRQPPEMWTGNPVSPARFAGSGINIWKDYSPSAAGFQGLPSPGDVKPYPPEPPPLAPARKQRTHSAAVRNTQIVLNVLSGVPANKTLLNNLPREQLFFPTDDASTGPVDPTNDPATTLDETTAPVMLDGWGNPIIFVPASGLRGVSLGDREGATAAPLYVITSVKPYLDTALPTDTIAPNARPFFASAGPDGVFDLAPGDDGQYGTADDVSGGDDNVYSFEN
jgi:type II secretory pathway pseudopilin PulG